MSAMSPFERVPPKDGPITPSTTALVVNHAPVTRTVDSLPALARRRLKPSEAVRSRVTRRTFIYARHSTDLQDTSEERQIDGCKAYSTKKKLDVVKTFADRGLSGTGMEKRAELQGMLAAARRKEVDVIVVEDLDRLSRSLPDLMAIFYELQLLGIELHDIQTGKLDLIHVVIRGYMGEEGRVRFLALSKAGKRNAVGKGLLMHKVHYGYCRDRDQVGVHYIDPETAEHLMWIYRVIGDGMSAGAAARDLTERGVLPPAQAHIVHGGGKILKTKPWHPTTVIKLVRSHLPLGFVSWGKTVPVYDSKSRIRTGYEVTDESSWIIVEHADLRIIDDETWTRANLRLSALTHPGAQAGSRFLLTGKAHCTCGALFKASSEENQVRYICSGRRLQGAKVCNCPQHHRLDWTERAVVEKVLAVVLHPDKLGDYATAFKTDVNEMLDTDVRRRGEILRRQTEIDNLQLKSFDAQASVGLSSQRMVKIRQALEEESSALEQQLDGLRRPSDFTVALAALEGIAGDVDRVLDEIPFRPKDPDGIAMAQAIRDAVAKVVVHPRDEAGFTRIEIEIDFLQTLRVVNGQAAEFDGRLGKVTLETGFNAFDLRKAEREARCEEAAAALEEAADGRHDLDATDWSIVEPFLRSVDFSVGGEIAPKLVVDGMFALAKAGGSIERMPARYGEVRLFRRAVKRVIYSGKWDESVAALRAADAACLHGANLRRFDSTVFQRRNAGVRPPDAVAERDRALLRKLAAKKPAGDLVALRYELVAMVLGGAPIGASAKALGLSVSSAYHHWDNYKDGGIDVLHRNSPRQKTALIDAAQILRLKAVATSGVDPDRKDVFITYPILCRVCRDRFGVEYSRGGMIIMARRHGFLLQKLVAAARRRRNLAAGLPVFPDPMPRRVIPARRVGTPCSKKARRAAARSQPPDAAAL